MASIRQAFDRRGWAGTTPASPPPVRFTRRHDPAGRPAAVLCTLFEESGEAHVILTRRSHHMRFNASEVSFPGGRLEVGEAALAAALREAKEEVGLDPAVVEILGPLSPLVGLTGQALITPFVGATVGRPHLHPNPAEVERVFDVSLRELLSEDVYREELWPVPGEAWRTISFFELIGDTVWGATAWMLRDLLELVLDL